MAKRYSILSCDGGGIRGLLTAHLLRELDRSTGLLKRVDLFAGTSTGGILALGLAGGVKIDRLIDLYKTKAEKIFRRWGLDHVENLNAAVAFKMFEGILSKIKKPIGDLTERSPDKLGAVKYANEGLLEAVRSVFPTDPLLTGLDRSVLVTTFRLDSAERGWTPVALHNLKGDAGPAVETHAFEAAMCTSAAPTYFEPYNHAKLGFCVDGGVFANNPGSLAASAAVRAGHGIGTISVLSVLSVGTGRMIARYPFDKVPIAPKYLGILAWMWPQPIKSLDIPEMPLLSALFDGTSACDRMVCEGLLGPRYQRLQVPLKEVIEMDDVGAVAKLEAIAKEYVKTEAWDKVVAWAEVQLGD